MPEGFVLNNKVNMYTSLGEYFIIEDNYALARLYLEKSLSLSQKYNYPYLSRTYMFMGDAELLRDSVDMALDFYHQALESLKQINLVGEFPLLYEKIASVYNLKAMPDSSMVYKAKHTNAEMEISQNKIHATKKALEVLMLEERKNHFHKVTAYSVVALILLLAIAVIAYCFWRARSRKYQKEIKLTHVDLERTKQEAFDSLIKLAKSNNPSFYTRFTDLYPNVANKILKKHPNLTNSDLEMCAMMYLNFSTKEIAEYTYIAVRSVQTKRSRLRKKLNLSPEADMYQYIQSLGNS